VFWVAFDKEQSTADCVADLVDWLHDIHHYSCQHLKVASDLMKAHYNCLARIPGGRPSLGCATQQNCANCKQAVIVEKPCLDAREGQQVETREWCAALKRTVTEK
jgi:hypothetical protein